MYNVEILDILLLIPAQQLLISGIVSVIVSVIISIIEIITYPRSLSVACNDRYWTSACAD